MRGGGVLTRFTWGTIKTVGFGTTINHHGWINQSRVCDSQWSKFWPHWCEHNISINAIAHSGDARILKLVNLVKSVGERSWILVLLKLWLCVTSLCNSCPSVGRSVGRLVCHDFLKRGEATLPCSFRSTFYCTSKPSAAYSKRLNRIEIYTNYIVYYMY